MALNTFNPFPGNLCAGSRAGLPRAGLPRAGLPCAGLPRAGLTRGIIATLCLLNAGPLAAQTLPSERALPPSAAQRALPSESMLPPVAARRASTTPVAAPLEAEADALRPINPDHQVWLRLMLRGHTAPIRALAFSPDASRLWTGGEDKQAHLWERSAIKSGGNNSGDNNSGDNGKTVEAWGHQATALAEMTRSALSGRIGAVATSDRWVALAGNSARNRGGDIYLAELHSGRQVALLRTPHQGQPLQSVASLAFSPNGEKLVSAHFDGRVLLWTRAEESGVWSAQLVATASAPEERLKDMQLGVRDWFFPVAWLDNERLLMPKEAGRDELGARRWSLQLFHLRDHSSRILEGQESRKHSRFVASIAVASQTGRVFSADDAGQVFFWSPALRLAGVSQLDRVALGLAATPEGDRLLLAMDMHPTESPGKWQLWSTPRGAEHSLLEQRLTEAPVIACAIAANGARAAVCVGKSVSVARIDNPQGGAIRWSRLQADVRRPRKLAFASGDGHQLRLEFAPRDADSADNADSADERDALRAAGASGAWVFDSQNGSLADAPEGGAWTRPETFAGDWSLTIAPDRDGRFHLQFQGQKAARLPGRGLPERPRSVCWIPDAEGNPFAVAINHSDDGVVRILRLQREGDAMELRRLRGHSSAVVSISLSHDRRYLATWGDDERIGFWRVDDVATAPRSEQLWGAQWRVKGDALIADPVRDDGPLFQRDVRSGDRLTRLSWVDAEGRTVEATTPPAMLAQLRRERETSNLFQFVHDGAALPEFTLNSAWHATAWLYVSQQRDWAFWTPRGYYNASFNGDQRFGWQVNRAHHEPPILYPAARFQKQLERPAVMSLLLRSGSLAKALAAPVAGVQDPALEVEALAAAQPSIEFIDPEEGRRLEQPSLRVRGRIRAQSQHDLGLPKLFANGVVCVKRRLLSQRPIADGPFTQEYLYEWDAALPSDREIQLQMIVATQRRTTAVATRNVVLQAPPPTTRPRMFLVAAGVEKYQEQALALNFAAQNARSIAEFAARQTLYDNRSVLMQDYEVTPLMWRLTTDSLARQLRLEATPNDLLIFFLSGHGVRDKLTSEYYYLGARARLADLRGGHYQDCLSFADVARFADVPCRKLAILDTCHSGAAQSLQQDHLKAPLRALQNDLVFTLTASEGHEVAFEDNEQRLGRFTSVLLEALAGAADTSASGGNGDGVVSLSEAAAYLQTRVPLHPGASKQHPTFGPWALREHADFPLANNAALMARP